MSSKGKTWKCSEETKRRRSEAMKRYYQNNPDKKLIGKKNPFYGKSHTDETKEKNRVAHLNVKQSKETVNKRTKVIREKFNGGWSRTNKFHTEETKLKISMSKKGTVPWNKGKNWSLEVKEKMSKARLNMKFSNEHKNNISKSLVKAYTEGRRDFVHKNFYSGDFYSKKNRKTFHYRSSYEWLAYRLLEQMTMVFSYEVEPFSIKYRKGYDEIGRYIPDILVIYIDGSKQLIEIKPDKQVDDKIVQRKIRAAENFCEKRGIEFVVWTEDQVFKKEIREPFRRKPVLVN